MRTAAEIRQRIIEDACHAVTHPGMHVTNGRDLEGLIFTEVRFLLHADERDDVDPRARLRRYGQSGVAGAFISLFGDEGHFRSESAVVMAHELNRFGYLPVERLLDPALFAEVVDGFRERFDEVDQMASQIVEDFGEPTFRVGSDAWAYGSEDPDEGWFYLSFWPAERTYELGSGAWSYPKRDADRMLRCAWTSEGPFKDTLALSIYTKLRVWGSGWTWTTAGAPTKHPPAFGNSSRPSTTPIRPCTSAAPASPSRDRRCAARVIVPAVAATAG